MLFARVWTDNSDKRDSTDMEKKGVEFITALTPLVSALAESQSTAVQGVSEPPQSLAAAVAGVTAADAKLGDELRTKERWADLKDKIGKLSKVTGPVASLNAHVEVTDLTLALYSAVRTNAELNRDPDGDVSNLQQAVAIDMPVTIVRVNRMGDYAGLIQNPALPAASRTQVQGQFAHEVLAVQDSVKQLTDDLQKAVDNTQSATLSSSLVSSLDSFRRGVESMVRGADPVGGEPSVATMTTAQSTLQGALSNLAGVTLREMDRLLDDRLDSLNYRRVEAVIMGALALLFVAGALIWPAFSRRREAEPAPAPERPIGESTRDVALNQPPGGYGGPGSYNQAPGYGEFDPTRRERSGAVR
ncbi:hypothetical protein [Paractinoplanes ovalisporus]|uniref:hypothetical protein n=1 Tax=Paractinoplanes ovalisporus TaxID=2810368 RepID=UPI0027DC1C01|nr:hypothetical protein [Actinoplanes ovalisporus]